MCRFESDLRYEAKPLRRVVHARQRLTTERGSAAAAGEVEAARVATDALQRLPGSDATETAACWSGSGEGTER